MAASSASSDGSQQANLVSNENAETKFGTDGAETTMVKLVDGKLTPIGDTHDDVQDEQLRNRYSSDEERSLQGFTEKTYETSDASLRGAEDVKPDVGNDAQESSGTYVVEDNGPATQTDEATYTLEEGVDRTEPANTSGMGGDSPASRVQSGSGQTNTFSLTISSDMVPMTPGTPDPNTPMPGGPDSPVPPTPPTPGPEIPDLPNIPAVPEIIEPSEPGRSHEINAGSNQAGLYSGGMTTGGGFTTPTATMSVAQNDPEKMAADLEPGQAVPGTQYANMSAGIDDDGAEEGMDATPNTGSATQPYQPDADAPDTYQAAERPDEAAQMDTQPRQTLDESSVKAQDMLPTDGDRTDTKSTDGLDLPYNDPQDVRDRTAY